MMKALNYWEQFTNSGKIQDYLTYKEQNREQSETAVSCHSDLGSFDSYAGIHTGDGDHHETIPYGRIR